MSSVCLSAQNEQVDSLKKVIGSKNDTAIFNALEELSRYYQFKNFDSATYYVEMAEQLTEKSANTKDYSKALFVHGNILYSNNFYPGALDCFTKALELANKYNDKLLKARCLERLASLHLETDDPNLALKLYFESLAVFEDIHNKRGIDKVYNILGVYKADIGEYDKAEKYLKKSLEINEQHNDEMNAIENKANLRYLFELKGDNEKAEKIYKELIVQIAKLNNNYDLPVIYFNLASISQKRKDWPKAIDYLGKAIVISEGDHDTSLLSSLYGNTGELLLKTGNLDSAMALLNKSVIYSRIIGDAETETEALGFIIKIDSISGDIKARLKNLMLVSKLTDTVFSRKMRNNLKAIELQYKNRKRHQKIVLQEQIIASYKQNKRLFTIIFIVSGAMLALLGWLFIVQRKSIANSKKLHNGQMKVKQMEIEKAQNEKHIQKLQKEKLEEELMMINREFVSTTIVADQTNELLNYVGKMIGEITRDESSKIDYSGLGL